MSDPNEIANDYSPAQIAAEEARQCRWCVNRDKAGWCSVKIEFKFCDDTCEEWTDE